MGEPRPRSSGVLSMSANRRKSYLAVDDEKQNIVEHFEQVQGRIEEVTRQSKCLSAILKKKVNVDKDHVKAIHKMTQSMHEDSSVRQLKFDGPLEKHWGSVKEQISAEAMHVSRVASTLEQQALQPLQVYMHADLEKRFRALVQEGRKVIKDYVTARNTLLKTRDRYYSTTAEWEASLLAIYSESGDSWNPTPGNKLYEREALLCRRMEEIRAEYEDMVDQTNALQQDSLGTQLPQVLEGLRNVAENMLAVMNNTLKCFSNMQHLLLHGEKEKEVHEQFNAAEYCHKVMFKDIKLSSIPPPPAYVFMEFPFQDGTLIVQTRKVQYRCMSKLSAKELANRGHMFLANGDKKRSTQQLPGKDTIQATDNTSHVDLVSICLEYLHKPLALKEEGLFRVSGDSSIMKSLLSDFTSGRATKEFLREAVMNQKDPNNISGLLKMHLREKNLLCDESIQSISQVLTKDMNELLCCVLDTLTHAELQLLTKVIKLLHAMVQQPWRTENKMSSHTLGIACGLSLFPQLDPYKATAFTQYLVDNYDALCKNHSVL